MNKKSYFPAHIETKHQFRQHLLSALSKFSNNYTTAKAVEELRELMTEHITNTDRMNTFLYQLNEQTASHFMSKNSGGVNSASNAHVRNPSYF
jgi:transcriptional regulator of heat shock response